MAGTHAILSPSKGEMILSCPAALGASKGVKDEPNRYAAEGTAYHEVASRTLEALKAEAEAGDCCDHYVGATIEADGFKFTIDDENAAHAQRYVDHVRLLGGLQFYEQKLDTSAVVGVPGQGGTADAVILDFEHDAIRIRDLKFGQRPVYAPNNKQYLQYGAAALLKYEMLHDWKFLEVGTEQPRINHFDTHTYSVDEVAAWIEENKPKFQRAYHLYLHPEEITAADFNPTDKGCEWCPIRGSCAARNQKFMDLFPKVAAKPLIHMDNAQLAEARRMVDSFEAWASSIKQEAHNRAVNMGQELPGFKVVEGRKGNRKWADEALAAAALAEVLADEAYKPREVISPADAQKKLTGKKAPTGAAAKWLALQENITQSDGAKSLVREDSAKPEVKSGLEFPMAPVVA